MSTHTFRRYLDILNEFTSTEIDQLDKALAELERVLGKYKSQMNEADRIDPPLFAPGDQPPPPKPHYKPGPNGTLLQQTASGSWEPVPPRPPSTANNPFGIRPGEASTGASPSTTGSTDANPFTRDAQGRPIPEVPSTGGTVTRTPTGTVHTARPPSPWKARGKAAAIGTALAGTAAAAYMYGGDALNALGHLLSPLDLKKLDPLDQETIKKNWAIVYPYSAPEVLKTVPTNIKTRIETVIELLKKIGMSDGGKEFKDRGVMASLGRLKDYIPGMSSDKPAPAPAPAADTTPVAEPLDKTLQNAHQFVKGMRESVVATHLSEVERMAQFRDILKEEDAGFWSKVMTEWGIPIALATNTGLVFWIQGRWKEFTAIAGNTADLGGANILKFSTWLVTNLFTWKKSLIALLGYGVWQALQLWGASKAVKKVDDVIQKLPEENNALKKLVDVYLKMSTAEFQALSSDQRNAMDETVLYYYWKFPQEDLEGRIQRSIIPDHPDWAGVKRLCKYHKDWPECQQILRSTP
jgi:hypothetical protein